MKTVAPLAGAWIETPLASDMHSQRKSRPSRARGLKLFNADGSFATTTSRPSRARGLKLLCQYQLSLKYSVAPLAGAWIETNSVNGALEPLLGRAPRGRVD